MDAIMALAFLIGNTSSSYILMATNYFILYCIATVCHLVALLYAIFFVPESLRERETEVSGYSTLSVPFLVTQVYQNLLV